MASVFDVAKFILNRTGSISAWKLQKLCYYAQAWSVAWTENAIFPERIEAWVNGPVCPELFQKHKGKFIISTDEIQNGNESALTDDEQDTISRVLDYYGDWPPYDLREQTHIEAPWRDARGNLPEDVPSDAEITTDSMGAYYGSL